MNKYQLIQIKDFNKVNPLFPKSVTAVITENKKWFPLLDNFATLHEQVAEKLVGDRPIFHSAALNAFIVEDVRYFSECIKIEVYGNGSYFFYMADEFTWKEWTWSIKNFTKSDIFGWQEAYYSKLNNLGIYSEIYKYFK